MNKPIKPDALTRSASTTPATWDAEARTVDVIAATETPVTRRDAAGAYLETLDMAALDLSRAKGLPVYDSHKGGNARDVVGIVEAVRVEAGQLIATLRLSGAADNTPVVERVAEGTLTGVSVGYAVQSWAETAENGQRVKRPAAWSLREISLTPNPADPNSRVRSENSPAEPAQAGDSSNRAESTKGGIHMPTEQTLESAEIERRSDIRGLVRAAGLPDTDADKLIDSGADLTRAKAEVFDATQARTEAAPIIRIHGTDNTDPALIRSRQTDALAYRMGAADELPEASRQYADVSLLDMARAAVERMGVSTRGMSRDEILERSAHSTSDFALVTSAAVGKTAMAGYKAAESPLKRLAKKTTLRDFKPSTAIRLGETGDLEELPESGEFQGTTRPEAGESIQMATYGRRIDLSRNLIVNDDLNMLADMASAFGAAAARTEAKFLLNLLTSNPNMADGTPVFDASRGNLVDSSGSFFTDTDFKLFETARQAMRGVTGLDGVTKLGLTPKYVVVGPQFETDMERALAELYPTQAAEVNPFAGKLQMLVEPGLGADKVFLFADPAQVPCLRYAYMAGAEGVQIQRKDAWDTLGLSFRAYLDFGAAWLDWRGAFLNADT